MINESQGFCLEVIFIVFYRDNKFMGTGLQ